MILWWIIHGTLSRAMTAWTNWTQRISKNRGSVTRVSLERYSLEAPGIRISHTSIRSARFGGSDDQKMAIWGFWENFGNNFAKHYSRIIGGWSFDEDSKLKNVGPKFAIIAPKLDNAIIGYYVAEKHWLHQKLLPFLDKASIVGMFTAENRGLS